MTTAVKGHHVISNKYHLD